MKEFTDARGRKWEFGITVGSMLRVKTVLGIDLMNLTTEDPEVLDDSNKPMRLAIRLTSDVEFFGRVLYAVCGDFERNPSDITVEQFISALDGQAFENSFNGLMEEIVDFFQRSGRPKLTVQARMLEKQLELLVAMHEAATAKMEGLSIDKVMEATKAELDQMDLQSLIDSTIESPPTTGKLSLSLQESSG